MSMEETNKLNIQVIKGGLYDEELKDLRAFSEEKKLLIDLIKNEPPIEKISALSQVETRDGMTQDTIYDIEMFNENRFTYQNPIFKNVLVHFYAYRDKETLGWGNITNAHAILADIFNENLFMKLKFATIDGRIHFHLTQIDNVDNHNAYKGYFAFTVEEDPNNFSKILKTITHTLSQIKKRDINVIDKLHIAEMKSYTLDNEKNIFYNLMFNYVYIDKAEIQFS